MNQQGRFLSSGATRSATCNLLGPRRSTLLDWFHLAVRFYHDPERQGLPATMGDETPVPLRDEVMGRSERTNGFLWRQCVRALHVLTTILFDLEMAAGEHEEGKSGKLLQVVQSSTRLSSAIGPSSPITGNATATASGSVPGLWNRRSMTWSASAW